MAETPPLVSEARTRPLKELAREIFLATLEELEVPRLFERKLKRCGSRLEFGCESVDLAAFKTIWVVSLGKAAWATFHALADLLGEAHRPSRGVVVSNVPPQKTFDGFMAYQAGHPYPDAGSLAAAETLLENLKATDETTLVFFLISGGGSALVEKPLAAGHTLEDMAALNRVLVNCGAPIDDINAVRKHLSAVKGGRLAAAAPKAHKVTLLLSDVPEGNLATIASGPTLPDPTTVATCYEVAARYRLLEKFPPAIAALFREKKLPETPKPGAEAFARAQTFLVASSRDVLHTAHRLAGARGFLAECEMSCDDAPLERAANCLFDGLERMRRGSPGQPVCLISGGEILCPVTGDGRGGRNQAFALYCAEKIADRDAAVLSGGTDGIDGNSPAAGAVADSETLVRAREKGLNPQDYFLRSDSFRFFDALGDTLVTGPQQNNLRDLRLLLAR